MSEKLLEQLKSATLGDALQVVGFLVSAVGFFSFSRQSMGTGIFFIIIALLIILIAFILQQHEKLMSQAQKPLFSLEKHAVVLSLEDREGDAATVNSTRRIIANHKGAKDYWINGINGDGKVKDILINDRAPDETKIRFGETRVRKGYSRGFEVGEKDTLNICTTWIKAFKKERENLITKMADPAQKLYMRVEFPQDRPCRTAEARLLHYGQDHASLPKPEKNRDGTQLELEVDNPRLGAEYEVIWTW